MAIVPSVGSRSLAAVGLALAFAGCVSPGSRGPAAEDPPLLQLPQDVRPVRYELELDLAPSGDRFQGTTAIEVALQSPRRVVWLHASGLRFTSATAEAPGRPAEDAAIEQVTSEGVAKVTLPWPAPAGSLTLRFAFSGAWGDAQTSGLYRIAVGDDRYVVSHLEPNFARRVFPCFDEPRFKTPFRVTLSARASDQVVSNAPAAEDAALQGGRRRVRFADTSPLPTYLLFAGAGPFEVRTASVPATRVRGAPLAFQAFAPRGRGGELALGMAEVERSLAALEEWFGLAYPYQKLDVVVVPATSWGGMENAGAILIRDNFFLFEEGLSSPERRKGISSLVAHELAHQWFGDLVTLPWWTDTWLNESFGQYLGVRIAERAHPDWGIGGEQAMWTEKAMQVDGMPSARAIRQPLRRTEEIPDLFDGLTYDKGQAVLATVERWVGEDRFRGALHGYLSKHAHGTASVDDLVAALSQSAGFDVGPMLRGFVDQAGIPLVSARLSCVPGRAAVELTQRRYQSRGFSLAEAAWQVPVCVRFPAGEALDTRCGLVEKRGGTIELGAECPRWVMPDAGGTGYYRWVLPAEQLAALGRAQLDPAERLSIARNVRAARRAGSLPVSAALDALVGLAADPDPDVAGAGMDELTELRERFDAADRLALEAAVRPIYRAVVGGGSVFEGPPGEQDAARRRRVRIATFLAREARDPEVRREASRRGLAFLGLEKGAFQPQAVSPDLAALALEVAVQESGAPVFEALVQRLSSTQDTPTRHLILWAVAGTEDPALAPRAAALWRDPRLRPNERLFRVLLSESSAARRRAFEQVRRHLNEITAIVPANFVSLLPLVAGSFCELRQLEEAKAVLGAAVERYPTMRLNATKALDLIRGCIAEREADLPAAQSWIRARAERRSPAAGASSR